MLSPSKKRYFFFTLIIICCVSTSIFSAPMLDIKADLIDYDQSKKTLHTSGNSQVVYKHFQLDSTSFTYDVEQGRVTIPGHYFIHNEGTDLEGQDFIYNTITRKGKAHSFCAKTDTLTLTGKRIVINDDRLVFHGATFTTCDTDESHYLISSERMTLFPTWGIIMFYSNSFYFPFLPFKLWIPTYFYGSRARVSGTLIPNIGSNAREGVYAKQRIPYFLNAQHTGALNLGYASELGGLYGLDHEFHLKHHQSLGFSAHSQGKDGVMGGLFYTKSFQKKRGAEGDVSLLDDVLSSFSDATIKERSAFSAQLSYRSLIHNSRVDFAPLFSFEIPEFQIKQSQFFLSSKTSYGFIREETKGYADIEEWRPTFEAHLTRRFQPAKTLFFEPFVKTHNHWHSHSDKWQRQFIGAIVRKEASFLNPSLGYVKVFGTGKSPFRYLANFEQENDEVHLGLSQTIKQLGLSMDLAYDLEKEKNRFWNVELSFLLNCVKFQLGYQIVEERYTFGVGL